MTYREQVTARKQLVEHKVLVDTHMRFAHKIYYRIDIDRLDEILQFANCGKRISGDAESAARRVRNSQFGNQTKTTTLSCAKEIDPKFEEAREAYLKRKGGSVKKTALMAWNGRIREGINPDVLIAAVKAYAKAMERKLRYAPHVPIDAGGGGGDDGDMEARITALEAANLETRDRLAWIETRLESVATREDLHNEIIAQTWRLVTFACSFGTALVAATFFVAKHVN